MSIFKKAICFILYIPILISGGFAAPYEASEDVFYKQQELPAFVKCWELTNNNFNTFASDNNQIILIENNGNIRQLNNTDLFQNWNIQLGSKLESIPTLIGAEFIIVRQTEINKNKEQQSTIRQIDARTGLTKWLIQLGQTGNLSTIINTNNKNVTYISDKMNIGVVESEKGEILWKLDIGGKLKSFTIDKNILFVLKDEDNLLQINLQDGTLISEKKLPVKKISKIFFDSGKLYLGDIKGTLYKFSKESNSIEKLFRTGGEISFIESDESNLLVSSNDNFIYFYSAETDKVLWKKRLSGRVILNPIIFKGLIFVTTSAEPLIYVFDRTDGSLVNQILTGDNSFIKKMEINESGLNVLTTNGLMRFGDDCEKQTKTGQ